jgi:hypothetical protein
MSDKNIPDYLQEWIDKIVRMNEEFVICRGNTVRETLALIRYKHPIFIPVFEGDDTVGIHYILSI